MEVSLTQIQPQFYLCYKTSYFWGLLKLYSRNISHLLYLSKRKTSRWKTAWKQCMEHSFGENCMGIAFSKAYYQD